MNYLVLVGLVVAGALFGFMTISTYLTHREDEATQRKEVARNKSNPTVPPLAESKSPPARNLQY